MSAYPRWLELEIAAIEHGDPPPRSTSKETTMSNCSKCSKELGANNKSGVCTPCQQGRAPAAAETVSVKPPPSRKPKAPAPGDVEEFFTLASALGLEPQSMLDTWCREWVEKTRARALGPESFTVIGPAGTVTASGDETEAAES